VKVVYRRTDRAYIGSQESSRHSSPRSSWPAGRPAPEWPDSGSLYPNHDLAAEVDISPPRIDRPGIYAALLVPEFWRVRNKAVSIEQLGPDGMYAPVPRSHFLPVRAEDVTRWIFSEDSSSLVAWEGPLRQWVRDELVPKADA
jgi:hypothetical protein